MKALRPPLLLPQRGLAPEELSAVCSFFLGAALVFILHHPICSALSQDAAFLCSDLLSGRQTMLSAILLLLAPTIFLAWCRMQHSMSRFFLLPFFLKGVGTAFCCALLFLGMGHAGWLFVFVCLLLPAILTVVLFLFVLRCRPIWQNGVFISALMAAIFLVRFWGFHAAQLLYQMVQA